MAITQLWDEVVVSALMLALAWVSQFFVSIGLDGWLLLQLGAHDHRVHRSSSSWSRFL